MNVKRRFVVLDRDGTIIEEVSYLSDPKQIALIPGAGKALRDLSRLIDYLDRLDEAIEYGLAEGADVLVHVEPHARTLGNTGAAHNCWIGRAGQPYSVTHEHV